MHLWRENIVISFVGRVLQKYQYLLPFLITTIALTITDDFGGSSAISESFPPKDERILKKWLKNLADALKRLAGKGT